jgi:protease-4
MSMDDGHHLYERRRLRRRIGFWRLVALLAVVGAAAAFAWQAAPDPTRIARVDITGTIFDDAERDAMLARAARDERIAAVIVRIDSPGGTVAGSEALYAALREVAERKPLVAVIGEVAASGGYIAALAADRIVARGNSITGSIGVIAEFPNIERLLDTLGIGFSRVASAPLKAEPSPFRAPSPDVLAAQQAVIADAYDWFVGLVAERRRLTDARARELGDGRIYSGRQALAASLIDEIGGEDAALAWLRQARGIDPDIPVRDLRPADDTLERFGLPDLARLEATLTRLLSGPRPMAMMP